MIIPSIDIRNGQTVQLVGGQNMVLDAGDPRVWARKFSAFGPVAVIDLDAAMGRGSTAELIQQLLPLARCRVGGGIRDVGTAIRWLDAGAESVIIGTAVRAELLSDSIQLANLEGLSAHARSAAARMNQATGNSNPA